ncbi:MAG: hypothetical protein QM771_16245 [Nitrospira sp.]
MGWHGLGPVSVVSANLGTTPRAFGQHKWVAFTFAASKRCVFDSRLVGFVGRSITADPQPK